MLKKVIIAAVILVIVGAVIIMVVPWGEYESDLKKTDLEETIEFTADTTDQNPSLDELEGVYKASAGETAEILFNTDGLKTTKGGFTEFEISFEVLDDYKNSSLNVVIQTASINTGNGMRDEHLVEEDFFHAEKYPTITFTSSEVMLGDTSYVAIGEMTMNGVTNPLKVPFLHLGSGGEDTMFEAFQGAFELDRTEFGQEEESGVGNIVKCDFYCELIKE
jgi:polyisoprenoid-binding protein YceI